MKVLSIVLPGPFDTSKSTLRHNSPNIAYIFRSDDLPEDFEDISTVEVISTAMGPSPSISCAWPKS